MSATIAWVSNEIQNYCVSRGISSSQAANIYQYVNYITGTAYPLTDRDATLVLTLAGLENPVITVAKACWGVVGTAGTTAAAQADIVTWIAANMAGINSQASLIGYIIHTYLGDAASYALVPSHVVDQDPNSSTFNTLIVISANDYAESVFGVLTLITKLMRHFAVKWTLYSATDNPLDAGLPNQAPMSGACLGGTLPDIV